MKKTVLLGVTGCVAAYKACEVVRGLQKAGLRVKVVMTKNATEFINPGQFRALTREPVAVGTFDDAPGDPIHHISLSKEADVFLIAPCTANVLGKIANDNDRNGYNSSNRVGARNERQHVRERSYTAQFDDSCRTWSSHRRCR